MRTIIKTYRLPIIVTLIMIATLCFWSWYEWQDVTRYHAEKENQRAQAQFNAIESTIKALGRKGEIGRDLVASVIETVIKDSPIGFVLLQQNGRQELSVGEIPPSPPGSPKNEIHMKDGGYTLQRDIRIEGAEPQSTSSVRMTSGPVLEGNFNMVLGFKAPPPDFPGRSRAFKVMMTRLIMALFLVIAGLIVWIMKIRGAMLIEQLKRERARSEHLEDMGLAAAGLAHETKNPLGIILGLAQQIAQNPKLPPESLEMLEHIIDEVDKAASRLGHFMAYARQRTVEMTQCDMCELVTKVASIMRPDFDAVKVQLEINCDPVMVLADEEMLQQILINLLLNSLHASSSGKKVTLQTITQGTALTITITDEGKGVSPELLPHIFKPYVSGEPGGHGLGLAIVKRFVEDHDWNVNLSSEPGVGTQVVISDIKLSTGSISNE